MIESQKGQKVMKEIKIMIMKMIMKKIIKIEKMYQRRKLNVCMTKKCLMNQKIKHIL